METPIFTLAALGAFVFHDILGYDIFVEPVEQNIIWQEHGARSGHSGVAPVELYRVSVTVIASVDPEL